MLGTMILVPAYGRDYRCTKAVDADFHADKDFQIVGGPYLNKSDLAGVEFTKIKIRFSKMTKVAIINIREKMK